MLNVDFVTEEIAKTIWMNNYPKEGLMYSEVTFSPGEGVGQPKTYNVEMGTNVRLPKNMFNPPAGSSRRFLGWKVENDEKLH